MDSKLWSLCRYLGRMVVIQLVGIAAAYYFVIIPQMKAQALWAYNKGFEVGRMAIDYKALALKDKEFSNNLCHSWWFEADHKLRKLNKD